MSLMISQRNNLKNQTFKHSQKELTFSLKWIYILPQEDDYFINKTPSICKVQVACLIYVLQQKKEKLNKKSLRS